jgi:hypothetical protein
MITVIVAGLCLSSPDPDNLAKLVRPEFSLGLHHATLRIGDTTKHAQEMFSRPSDAVKAPDNPGRFLKYSVWGWSRRDGSGFFNMAYKDGRVKLMGYGRHFVGANLHDAAIQDFVKAHGEPAYRTVGPKAGLFVWKHGNLGCVLVDFRASTPWGGEPGVGVLVGSYSDLTEIGFSEKGLSGMVAGSG